MCPDQTVALDSLAANGIINYDADSYIKGVPPRYGVPKDVLNRPLMDPYANPLITGPRLSEQPNKDAFKKEEKSNTTNETILGLTIAAICAYPAFKFITARTKGTKAYAAREAKKAEKAAQKVSKFTKYAKWGGIGALSLAGIYGAYKLFTSGFGGSKKSSAPTSSPLKKLQEDTLNLTTRGSQTPKVANANPETIAPPMAIIGHKELAIAPETQTASGKKPEYNMTASEESLPPLEAEQGAATVPVESAPVEAQAEPAASVEQAQPIAQGEAQPENTEPQQIITQQPQA